MKANKKSFVLVVVFMLGTLLNYANNNAKGINKTINAEKVKVAFKNVKKGHELTIKDDKGVQLHSEIVSRRGLLTKVFDFSSLKDGKYTIELDKDFEIVVKTLEIKNNKVIFNEDSKSVFFKPVVRNDDNLLLISKLGFKKEPLKIALYFDDAIIYSETVKDEASLERVYKLDEKLKGDYKVVITDTKSSYTHDFKI